MKPWFILLFLIFNSWHNSIFKRIQQALNVGVVVILMIFCILSERKIHDLRC